MQEPFPSSALQSLLEAHTDDTQGLLLRLAWRVGLERTEIENLQWIQCSPTHITISGRSIPVEREVSSFLSDWQILCQSYHTPFVAVSKRYKKHMSGTAISQMIKRTLSGAGIEHITLVDLRRDYVRRQMENKDWQEALQVTGISVSSYFRDQRLHSSEAYKTCHETYKASASSLGKHLHVLDADTEAALLSVMDREKHSLAGLAIRLAYYTDIEVKDMVSLTWDQIQGDQICLPGHDPIALPLCVQEPLYALQASRLPTDDMHVFLTERTRKPMDESWLLVLVRKPLVGMGIGFVSFRTIRAHITNKQQQKIILDALETRGSLSLKEATELLDGSQFAAKTQLRNLQNAGILSHVQARYYKSEDAPSTDRYKSMLCSYMAEHGPSGSADMAQYLCIGKRRTAKLLREMVDDGTVSMSRYYGLYWLASQDVSL